ncbi:MAG: Tol-Pal system beta propeller repeat protein TolB [candidate division Zixibacteria bacterium]
MRKENLLLIVFMIGLFSFSNVLGQKRSEVGGTIIAGPSIELLSIAVEDFRMPSGFSTIEDSLLIWDLKQVMTDDLIFSLYFNVVQVDSAFMTDFARGAMALDDWIYLGAQLLVSGRIERELDGLIFTVDVTDIYRNKNVYNRDFIGPAERYRYLAHQAAADLLYNLTGEEGSYFSKFVYSSDATGKKEIHICDFDGFAPVQITNNKSINVLPSWSHDGERIYFTSYQNGNPDLFTYVFAQEKPYVVSSRQGLNSAGSASPDGKYIACTLTIAGNSEVYILDQTGRIIRRLTFTSMIDSSPAWSPSSREIAFTSDRTGTPQIYITDIEGLNTRRLTYHGNYNDQPSWSPRGDLITYASREPEGFQIYTIDITGQYARKLTEIGANESPSWSPDGLHIVYSHITGGRYQLHVMDYDGGNKKRIVLPGNCKTPEWSKNLR